MAKKRKVYASKRRNDARKAKMVKDDGGWADWKPKYREYGVYACARTTYKHNGETKLV